MANYYSDYPELEFHLHHPLMERIVELKERGYSDRETYDDAPVDFEDALENYNKVLEIAGDIAANIIEPNSESVDLEGPHLENGRMIYASKTYENIEAMKKAGLTGVEMPRRYGGLNLSLPPIPASRTSGRSRAASTPSTNSEARNSVRSTSRGSAQANPCLWTLPNRMPVQTFRG